MWALRRVSTPLRNQGYRVRTSSVFGKLEIPHSCEGNTVVSTPAISERCISLERNHLATWQSSGLYMSSHGLSSQAGAENNAEEDENEGKLTSESELDDLIDETRNELDLLEVETELSEKVSTKKTSSELFKVIWCAPELSVPSVLDKWISEGKELSRAEVSLAMYILRRRRMFGKALQFSEWLEKSGQLEFIEKDYASRLDFIAKVRGLHKAESYIAKIPKSFQGKVVYRTFLAKCVAANNEQKAEEIFNKIKDLKFPIITFDCNQMLLLYKKRDKRKIEDVVSLMKREDVKLSPFTYRILIDAKGLSNDIVGMEQVVETTKAEGIELDATTLFILAKHYTSSGFEDKAKAILKKLEDVSFKDSRQPCRFLLPLYGELQMEDEVRRVWKICESNPLFEECMAAVVAWGKLKNVPEAEAIFDRVLKKWKKLDSKEYSTMLNIYAENKMLMKGKDLVKQMADRGCRICPLTWNVVVKLYVEAGEVEKADSFLQKAVQQSQMKPLFTSYMVIMDQYARRGDVHKAEKIFHTMRLSGYVAGWNQFQVLMQAYINAKVPAYGMKERIKADKLFINKALTSKLDQVDAFRKTAVSDLLD